MFSKKSKDYLDKNAAIAEAVASGEKMGRSWHNRIFGRKGFDGPFGGPSSSQVKQMLDDGNIKYS